MYLVISYDISDDERRRRVADLLKDYGRRVQYSVFECELEKKHIGRMTQEAVAVINQVEDSLIIYTLCAECVSKIETYGVSKKVDTGEGIVI